MHLALDERLVFDRFIQCHSWSLACLNWHQPLKIPGKSLLMRHSPQVLMSKAWNLSPAKINQLSLTISGYRPGTHRLRAFHWWARSWQTQHGENVQAKQSMKSSINQALFIWQNGYNLYWKINLNLISFFVFIPNEFKRSLKSKHWHCSIN